MQEQEKLEQLTRAGYNQKTKLNIFYQLPVDLCQALAKAAGATCRVPAYLCIAAIAASLVPQNLSSSTKNHEGYYQPNEMISGFHDVMNLVIAKIVFGLQLRRCGILERETCYRFGHVLRNNPYQI